MNTPQILTEAVIAVDTFVNPEANQGRPQAVYTTSSLKKVYVDLAKAPKAAKEIVFTAHNAGDPYLDKEGNPKEYKKAGTTFVGFTEIAEVKQTQESRLAFAMALLAANPEARLVI